MRALRRLVSIALPLLLPTTSSGWARVVELEAADGEVSAADRPSAQASIDGAWTAPILVLTGRGVCDGSDRRVSP
jgi:hypothetical protein